MDYTEQNKIKNKLRNKLNREKIENYIRYQKPKVTITDLIQNNDDIKDQLKNFVEIPIKELDNLCLYTYIKYITFSVKENKELFRIGGKLIIVKDNYIILRGRNCNFSVQKYVFQNGNKIYTTKFFIKSNKYKKKTQVLETELNETIDKANNMYLQQTVVINKQKEKINKLKRKFLKLKNSIQ